MTPLAIAKPWIDLTSAAVEAVPGQLGVYEIADADGRTLYLGYAGGREPFGLRSALTAELARPGAVRFRHELTHGYLTRWEELLMVHHAVHGQLPPGNADHPHRLGRLHVEAVTATARDGKE